MRVATIIALLLSVSVSASITEAGRGMLFGEDHAFAVSATAGWVLDNQSGVRQGLHMLFYPKGESWANSPVIIYGRAVSTSESANVKIQVERTVKDFRNSGNPNYSSKAQESITLSSGQQVTIYHFSGDRWGNYEAAAYFQEKDTINYLVFSSRKKKNFTRYLEDFYRIVSSYKNLYISPSTIRDDKQNLLKGDSSSILVKAGGKEYESKAFKSVGDHVAKAMRDCTSYIQNNDQLAFSYYVRIKNDGSMKESYVYPTNSLSACFRGLMSSEKYPPHSFESFVLNIEMKVSD